MASASTPVASIFAPGKLSVKSYPVKQWDPSPPPTSVLIVTPVEPEQYPVVLFLHGFLMQTCFYSQLLGHIASHGYITVAPQLNLSLPCYEGDIELAAAVINWLSTGLRAVLPPGVHANLDNHTIALSGHSKGGHTAFALALKKYTQTTLDFSVLMGIDPVAGIEIPFFGWEEKIPPVYLTNNPDSLDINVPVMVIGSELGEEKKLPVLPACAPKGLNHAEFYKECKAPSCYFVVKDYGHLDMLDDAVPNIVLCACKEGEGCRGRMRRSIGGLAVAFLEAYVRGDMGDLLAVLRDPSVAPAKLGPVSEKGIPV